MKPHPVINGLFKIENFIDDDQHDDLVRRIDASPWDCTMKRAVQHYGYRYDYRARKISTTMRCEPIPDWLDPLASRLDFPVDQVIINDYQPGQGISAHIDCLPCFGDEIATLSLLADVVMTFQRKPQTVRVLLPRSSLLILSGEARSMWTHAIKPVKTDHFDGVTFKRKRRISITFRDVIKS